MDSVIVNSHICICDEINRRSKFVREDNIKKFFKKSGIKWKSYLTSQHYFYSCNHIKRKNRFGLDDIHNTCADSTVSTGVTNQNGKGP
jgi:hypothetical protein